MADSDTDSNASQPDMALQRQEEAGIEELRRTYADWNDLAEWQKQEFELATEGHVWTYNGLQ